MRALVSVLQEDIVPACENDPAVYGRAGLILYHRSNRYQIARIIEKPPSEITTSALIFWTDKGPDGSPGRRSANMPQKGSCFKRAASASGVPGWFGRRTRLVKAFSPSRATNAQPGLPLRHDDARDEA